jgi:NADPH2:quinone reductase
MPKAVRFHELGGPEVLKIEDVTLRDPGEGEVAMKVAAVGLNRAESMYFHGQYMEQPELPSGLGYEAVGIITAVGRGVGADLVGRRFGTIPGFSMNRFPALAEEAVFPADALAELPASLSAAQGAAVWMQYATAYGALVPLGRVGAGDFVIITAASSSVGLAAIQIARAQGATAIATTRTSAKRQQLLELGAHHVIATQEEDLPARVREITGGKGARVVFDPVGGDYVNTLAQAVATEGTIYLYGMLSGQPTSYPMAAFGKGIALTGYTLMQMKTPERLETMKRYIVSRLEDGSFSPRIDRLFPFADIVDAYRYLESNVQVGKIVVTF